MPSGAHCNHCDEDRAVVAIQDYENDRFIYVCSFCGWWGLDPLRIDSPPTPSTRKHAVMSSPSRLLKK
jgi:hypothetical protein